MAKRTMFVFRPKRRTSGRIALSRFYVGRYQIDGMATPRDVRLNTLDKQVAERRLREIVAEYQQERDGIIPPRALREAAERDMLDHLCEYIADLECTGHDDEYVSHVNYRVRILAADLGWKRLRDMNPDAFQRWRSHHLKERAPKTLNEFLNSLTAFSNWLVKNGRLATNPFKHVDRIDTVGRERVQRRALTDAEMRRLLAVAGTNRIAYLTAVTTGLRRGELDALIWEDISLAQEPALLTVRAETAKNRRAAELPLTEELAEALRQHKPVDAGPSDRVFLHGVPSMKIFKRDLRVACIEQVDQRGRCVDFHALRKTLCTNLARAGVNPWKAMRLMRHSDIKFTVKTYTDTTQLDLNREIAKLPSFGATGDLPKTA